jgi:hypothetical protein
MWSARGVITPIVGPHNGLHLELPWKIAVVTYGLELHNLLTKRYGYTFDQAIEKTHNALIVYDREIHDLLNVLIEETVAEPIQYKDYNGIDRSLYIDGLPILFCRNPE